MILGILWASCLNAQTYTSRLEAIALAPDAKIVAGASNKEIVFWDISKQTKIFERKGKYRAHFLNQSNKILLAGEGKLEILNPQSFQTEKTFSLEKDEYLISIEPREAYALIRKSNYSLRKITLPGLEE